MYIDGKILDLLFRQTAPEKILEVLANDFQSGVDGFLCLIDPNESADSYLQIKKQPIVDVNHFLDYADTTLHGYSEDEHRLLYEQLNQQRAYWKKKGINDSCGFLAPLIDYTNRYLKIVVDEPVCRYGMALGWRDAYLRLGQDLFVTAFLAWNDHCNNIKRKDFTWPVILRVDQPDVYHNLQNGFAENHNHLAGGTQSYQVTWCRMMNYPAQIREELKHFRGSNLFSKSSRGEKGAKLDKFDMLELAALVRSILFRALHRDEFINSAVVVSDSQKAQECNRLFDGRTAFGQEYLSAFSFQNKLADTVDCLRNAYGIDLPVLGHNEYCLDYAMEDTYFRAGKNKNIRIVIGERSFLYRCMRACLDNQGFMDYEKELFYLYLVLQCNFRSEMIQTNEQTGFLNFKNYQDRKDDAWEETPYFCDAIGMALNNRLNHEHITSLEGRMAPKPDVEKNIKKVFDNDLAKRFSDCEADELWDKDSYEFTPDLDLGLFENASWFYVFHYFKVRDERKLEPKKFMLAECRHQKHRDLVKEQTKGFVKALRKSPYFRSRVRGIDAASEEVLCRPEIFAVGYRYIDAVQEKWNVADDGLLPSSPIRISKTYHAGEDFLDIASGLRAIDEAIRFLHMGPHSRIGHALAMGVDPEIHYNTKSHEIVITKQDRLDDLVWILYRSNELGIVIERSLEVALKNEAEQLFREIYSKAKEENHWNYTLHDYWNSMKLRGDDPSVYRTGEFKEPGLSFDEINAYLIDNKYKELEIYRKDTPIAGLYYLYHFDIEAGLTGKETLIKRVDKDYIALMHQLQDAMMKYIESRNLIIEINPSSNVLIGTFKDYCKHPVFRFNNRKLPGMMEYQQNGSVQMHVCVNTDDLGVFDTSLEFEYVLLYEALQKLRDETGVMSYSDQDILDYLDDLRQMGIRAVFPSATSV